MEYWKTIACPHAVSIKYSRDLWKLNVPRTILEGKSLLNLRRVLYSRTKNKLEYGWQSSGFEDGRVRLETVAFEVELTAGGLEGAWLKGSC